MSNEKNFPSKPALGVRSSMTRKPEGESESTCGKPTLSRQAAKTVSRSERISQALLRLDDERLRKLTTQVGADELAVALLDTDRALKERVASCLAAEPLEVFKEHLSMSRDRFPGDVIDGVQGKVLRLAL